MGAGKDVRVDDPDDLPNLQREQIEDLGIKGLSIDFWESVAKGNYAEALSALEKMVTTVGARS